MALSAEMAAIAVELIDEYGGNVTFTYEERDGDYDVTTGTYGDGTTPDPKTVKALAEDKGLWLDGVVKGEKKVTVASSSLTVKPLPADKFTVRGQDFTVMDKGIVETEIEGVVILYEIYGVK